MTTIFEKIINGDIPCHKIYEDDLVLAFLDVAPLSKGHTLVIPKQAVANMHELSEESGAALGRALVKITSAVVEATGATDYNILQNNGESAHQAVFHVHFHIIPKFDEKGLKIEWVPEELTDGENLANDIVALL
ncbi:MAG: HIT family protein [Phycisphaerales bacterium]|jgi:histidine triad (HIT) family protein|nr:HIT family protein [Phycisphaerales bacterium]